MLIEIPKEFVTQEEIFDYLHKSHDEHIHQKKASLKEADCMIPVYDIFNENTTTSKGMLDNSESGIVKVRAIINTTNVMDSHGDVHLPKIWDQSLKLNKFIKHLQEHQMSFKNIISDKDDLNAFVKTYAWRDLMVDKDGKTQALVFDSDVKESRNPYMFDQYKGKHVDNHSVGMFYVNLKFAMNSKHEDHKKYLDEYNKHIDTILNKEVVDKKGFFWAVYEAKVREGSAVPLGSNYITPTLSRSKGTQFSKQEIADQKSLSGYINFLNQR